MYQRSIWGSCSCFYFSSGLYPIPWMIPLPTGGDWNHTKVCEVEAAEFCERVRCFLPLALYEGTFAFLYHSTNNMKLFVNICMNVWVRVKKKSENSYIFLHLFITERMVLLWLLSSSLLYLSWRDVKRFKDVRKEFERSSENLEAALSRNAQAPRGKQHEVEEASNNLLNARRAFRSGALDYVLQVQTYTSIYSGLKMYLDTWVTFKCINIFALLHFFLYYASCAYVFFTFSFLLTLD